MEAVQALGCICCWMEGGYRPAEIHHVTDSGRRMGHGYVLPLCEWHHRAVPPLDMTKSEARQAIGPSLAESKADFVRLYGTERQLLALVQSRLEAVADGHGEPCY